MTVPGPPRPLPASGAGPATCLAVAGAHLRGEPLHPALLALGARFVRATRTAPVYRMIALPALDHPATPPRPGLVRDPTGARPWRSSSTSCRSPPSGTSSSPWHRPWRSAPCCSPTAVPRSVSSARGTWREVSRTSPATAAGAATWRRPRPDSRSSGSVPARAQVALTDPQASLSRLDDLRRAGQARVSLQRQVGVHRGVGAGAAWRPAPPSRGGGHGQCGDRVHVVDQRRCTGNAASQRSAVSTVRRSAASSPSVSRFTSTVAGRWPAACRSAVTRSAALRPRGEVTVSTPCVLPASSRPSRLSRAASGPRTTAIRPVGRRRPRTERDRGSSGLLASR